MELIDAHVHLAQGEDPEREILCAEARDMVLMTASIDERDTLANLELSRRHPGTVRCFGGIHPSEAAISPPDAVERLLGPLERADGIGEIGLDGKYPGSEDGGAQNKLFLAFLQAAERLGRPIQVHTRGMEAACLDHLSTFRLRKVLLHWFESEEHSARAASRGYYVSFGPAVLYSKKIARIARGYPEDLILTETDGPVRYGPLGMANGSSLIASVVFSLACTRGSNFGTMRERVASNGAAFLE